MLHARGKGIVNRIWTTSFYANQRIKIYFDGEKTPSINESVVSFFSSAKAPFLSPLVADDPVSSGGFISYMPFPFEKEIIIVTDADDLSETNYFNNINYQIFENDANVTTWSGSEDLSTARSIFSNKGEDPRSNSDYTTQTNTIDLAQGETQSVINITKENQTVSGLLVEIPDLELGGSESELILDQGRAHKDYSEFDMNIDPGANAVVLKRRLDFAVSDQKADVYIDGEPAGEWFTPFSDASARWRDAEFIILNSLTTGKSKITVKIVFVSEMIDWNEFHYWTYCDEVQTDSLDINNQQSEQSHNYTISGQSWSGSGNHSYGTSIGDDGRAHTGHSQFTLKVKPDASEYKLTRRLNFGIANQKARVLVDGTEAGEWYDQGKAQSDSWADSEFIIPASLVASKNEIVVKIEFLVNHQTRFNYEKKVRATANTWQYAYQRDKDYDKETQRCFSWIKFGFERDFHYPKVE